MKIFMGCVEALEPSERDAIRAAIGAEDLRLVEAATPVAWLPVEINLRATEAVGRVLGPQGSDLFFRRLGDQDFESSLLKSIVTGAIGIFGLEPSRLMRWVPRGWAQLFRDSTQITLSIAGAGKARLTFAGLPPMLAKSRVWRDSVASSMSAFYKATKREGTVEVESSEPATSTMVLLFRWR